MKLTTANIKISLRHILMSQTYLHNINLVTITLFQKFYMTFLNSMVD